MHLMPTPNQKLPHHNNTIRVPGWSSTTVVVVVVDSGVDESCCGGGEDA
jgi:hypothetical protein